MKFASKLGVIAVTALTFAPVAINPTVASAKVAKKHVYKISKNLLKHHTIYKRTFKNGQAVTRDTIAFNRSHVLVDYADVEKSTSSDNQYIIKSAKVNKNVLTYKLASQKGYRTQKGNGKLVVVRTGKNSYQLKGIYTNSKLLGFRINKSKVISDLGRGWVKPTKKSTLKGYKVIANKNLNSIPFLGNND